MRASSSAAVASAACFSSSVMGRVSVRGSACGAVLTSALDEGNVNLKRVAAQLRMSERSLQRRLADEGEIFDAIVDALRRDLAPRYLADPKIAVAEVAYLLGYSEPSPFHRAFKRWTGRMPAEARRGAARA